jgi:hypothetical protein
MEKRLVNTRNRSTSCMKDMGVPWKYKKWKQKLQSLWVTGTESASEYKKRVIKAVCKIEK